MYILRERVLKGE
jgi:ATP-dependent RNA helicase DDX54/DBP10